MYANVGMRVGGTLFQVHNFERERERKRERERERERENERGRERKERDFGTFFRIIQKIRV
jgi:hypothetical protein